VEGDESPETCVLCGGDYAGQPVPVIVHFLVFAYGTWAIVEVHISGRISGVTDRVGDGNCDNTCYGV